MTDYYPIPYRTHGFRPSQAFPNQDSSHYPIVDVTLRYNGTEVSCPTVIDSGTHFSLFPFTVGEQLGLKVAEGKKAIVPPEELVYFWQLEITLENRIEFPLYAGFSVYQDGRKVGLLGQLGFFDKFDVTFEQGKGRILLRPRSPDIRIR